MALEVEETRSWSSKYHEVSALLLHISKQVVLYWRHGVTSRGTEVRSGSSNYHELNGCCVHVTNSMRHLHCKNLLARSESSKFHEFNEYCVYVTNSIWHLHSTNPMALEAWRQRRRGKELVVSIYHELNVSSTRHELDVAKRQGMSRHELSVLRIIPSLLC